jgi:thiol-disulfide isomerase/thioredoxin
METVNVVWIAIAIAFMAATTYYIYLKFIKKNKKDFVPNDEYVQKLTNYECILFYTEWCPHCKKTIKEWNEYKNSFPDERARFTMVDCDKNSDQAELYQVDSYPTIIMVVHGKHYIFDSNFSKEAMDKFVSTILKI